MTDNPICPICNKEYYGIDCPHLARHIVPLVHEARYWARKMYLENAELRRKITATRGDSFLLPSDVNSVERAAYEFLNGQTEDYRMLWLNELASRILSRNDRNEAELHRQLETLVSIQDFITTEMDEYSDGQLDDLEIVKDVYFRLNRAFAEIETLHQVIEKMDGNK
jgi:hypothetical protein